MLQYLQETSITFTEQFSDAGLLLRYSRIYNQTEDKMHFMSKMAIRNHTNFNMHDGKLWQKYRLGIK